MRQQVVAGRYRLRQLVGTGGMGRVWLAHDEMLHREVAVKEVVPPSWLAETERDELRLRTLREARTAARVDHPNVVRLYDVVHEGESPWIVMEYVRSRSLQQIITTEGPLDPRRTAEVGLAVLAALRAAHAAGVLHRDVKPHNVLVADDGRVVLTDFGLATFEGGDGAMTGPGLVLGSPQFVAPERARDGVSDPRTDMWSLGATLYAAVEGQSPYARGNAMATLSALATEPPDPVRRAGPLRPALTGLLQRDPWRRLTAAEVEPLLRAVAGSAPVGPGSSGGGGGGVALPAPRDPGTSDRVAGLVPAPFDRVEQSAGPGPVAAAGVELPVAGGGGPRPAPGSVQLRPVTGHPVGGTAGGRYVDPAPTAETGGRRTDGAPEPRPSRPGRSTRRTRLVGVGAAVALLAGAGVAVALHDADGPDRLPSGSGAGSPAATAPATTGAASTGPAARAAVPAAFACGTAPPTATPVATTPPRAGEDALLPGWTWYRDPAGWRVAAPTNWLRWTESGATCFREPDGSRLLSVAPVRPTADPVAYWRAEERRLRGTGALRDYRLVEISALEIYGRDAAIWECAWRNAADLRVHSARLLARPAPGRAYAVAWLTTEFDWLVNGQYFLMIRQSFGDDG
ncbi:serine/threonine-protein kinase [Micromonospora mirobrigensis]|uniref:non-specific serine/threonine protein kinase n=1 Tax=Micromonospora mirobrigensis TaxID=262898 RepID=A0A1C4X4L5_9ACTN|nr:serine/threonine-protein kinase [Micromonospora mirobrigensis]SCF03141.1 Serine/threonine protein kinase [Micromonospora mirobrigensis]